MGNLDKVVGGQRIRSLPAEDFDFVELVERGRPDWLAGDGAAPPANS